MFSRTPTQPFAATMLPALGALLLATAATTGAARADSDQEMVCKERAYEMGIKYQQKSAEVDALQLQAYDVARDRLQQHLEVREDDENIAIVMDVDETVVDNTRLLARDIQACHDYTPWDTWAHWEREGHPDLIPGAMDFLNYANENGVAIYYISNRFNENKPDTIATMKKLGLPQVNKEQVKLYDLSKEERRNIVREDHRIVMLLGDSLADFHQVFDDASLKEQRSSVAGNADKFGNRWIIFPNATYGDWDGAELDAWDAPLEVDE